MIEFNPSSDVIFSILLYISLSFIALMTACGNLVVICAFYCDKKLRTTNDYFILNMAIADFLVGFICIPFYIPFSVKQIWPFGRIFCKIWVTIDDVATMASVINIVAISINRYWSIAYPISYRKYAKQNFVYLSMASVWLISFINFAPGIWLISLFDKTKENGNDCSGDYSRSFIYMLIAQFNYFIWPFIVLCILNILIMFNLWKRSRKMDRLKYFHYPNINRRSSKFSIKHLSFQKSYQIKTNNSLIPSCPRQTLTEKVKSSSNCPEGVTYLTSFIEQNSSIIKTKRQINSLDLSINSKKRQSLKKTRRSTPSIVFSRKSSNINRRISRNCRSDSIVEYHLPTVTEVQFIQPINNAIKVTNSITRRDLRMSRDRKAARSLFILVIVFLIFLFPYVICAIATTAGIHISATLFGISFWLLWLNSTCNPFLYPFIQIKYRRAYAKLFQSFRQYFTFKK